MSETDHKQEINIHEYQKLVDETLEDEEKVDKINIEDYLDEETMKLKYKEYIDKLQKNKPNPVESKTVNGKTIYKSETKAGLRKGTKKNNEDVLETAIKEEANKRDDVDKKKLKTKVDEIILVIMDTPLETCLKRNSTRVGRRFVPEDVIKRMYKSFKPYTENELFTGTIYLKEE